MNDALQVHYRRLATQYNDLLSYSPDFVREHTQKMIDKLELCEDDILLDLGCGTGMYSLDILEQVPRKRPVIGVDPYSEMLEQTPDDARIERVPEDAVDFTAKCGPVTKALIKEAVHHIERKRELFINLYDRLEPGGRLLLVHIPPEIEYPLFRQALERSRTWHADPHELVRPLTEAGFRVERDELCWDHHVPRDHYFGMVEHRYMSLLSSFDDDELRVDWMRCGVRTTARTRSTSQTPSTTSPRSRTSAETDPGSMSPRGAAVRHAPSATWRCCDAARSAWCAGGPGRGAQ